MGHRKSAHRILRSRTNFFLFFIYIFFICKSSFFYSFVMLNTPFGIKTKLALLVVLLCLASRTAADCRSECEASIHELCTNDQTGRFSQRCFDEMIYKCDEGQGRCPIVLDTITGLLKAKRRAHAKARKVAKQLRN